MLYRIEENEDFVKENFENDGNFKVFSIRLFPDMKPPSIFHIDFGLDGRIFKECVVNFYQDEEGADFYIFLSADISPEYYEKLCRKIRLWIYGNSFLTDYFLQSIEN